MIKKTIDELLEGRQLRRMKEEDRFLDRMDRRIQSAEKLIGELCRDGRTMFYINERRKDGTLNGRIREFERRFAATDFLLRNRYV